MAAGKFPEQFSRLHPGEMFSFLCHNRVSCFTLCCRELELALTPYDVLRLRLATGLNSAELHERYIIEELASEDTFPRFYLTMVDDGQASCVFVNDEGCSIYPHRPGACRTYPLGRGTTREQGQISEQFVLLREPHCKGFKEKTVQTPKSFMQSQELAPFNLFNDRLTVIIQHPKIQAGLRLSSAQLDLYKLALYDLDTFRAQLADNLIEPPLAVPDSVYEEDDTLLEFGLDFIEKLFFDR
ncbi:MAG: YkgJ family cysteine cluster protein [Desulfofustis sp.]|nr:YkgJ family cysteine cluster protein [Desulfofustis sp.]NNK57170.1 YkgJ family cysteine cluster protein [Desulfofustis sp.]